MNKKEKNVFWTASFLLLITGLVWLSFYVFSHLSVLPSQGGEYTEGLVGAPKLINPIFESVNDVDGDISSLLYAKLFKHGDDRQLTPDLIETYEISEDKKTYTFKIRDDAYWSDGKKITSNDAAFTIDSIQNPEVGSPLFTSLQGVLVEKIDDLTFSLTLKEPFSPFLNSLAFGLIPEHIFGQINPANIRLAKDNLQPVVVSGPYKFTKLLKDNLINRIQTYTLESNEKYFGNKPYLKNIVFRFYDDFEQALGDLKNQNIDGLSFVPNEQKEKVVSKSFNLYDLQLPQYVALFFNQNKNPILKDEALRNSLAQSIDKKIILEKTLKNNGQIIHAPILKNEPGYYPEIKKAIYDLDEANAQLDKNWSKIDQEAFLKIKKSQILKSLQEKYPITTSSPTSTENETSLPQINLEEEAEKILQAEVNPTQLFYRKDKNDNILSLTITTANIPEYINTANLVADFWKNIGIQTFVEIIDSKKIVKENIRERNYSILLFGEILSGDPDPYAFWHSSQTQFPGLNLALFSDKEADKLIEEARVTDDKSKREETYKKFQDILAKKIPAIFLYTPTYTYAIEKNIKGVNVGPLLTPADRFNTISKWYIKTAKRWK
ncbi:MAG TPA: peptide ABC transporter substrate-binding protein [Candidatus Magasanikbacteria bacterium]|nr:peptide ABC transporter substrate-binding protein [Candidatus Magasanikbacteria bacterium]